MACAYECSECEHVQLVGVLDNGLSGLADPHVVCESCGAVGQFHYRPGYAAKTRAVAAGIARFARNEQSHG